MSTTGPSRTRGGRKRNARPRLDAVEGAWTRRGRVLLLPCLLGALPILAQSHYLVPDSSGHVVWGRSLLWDRDVEFTNEYARFGSIEREGNIVFAAPTAAGHPGNPFGMGSALLWMPCLVGAAGVARLLGAMQVAVASDGFGTLTLHAAALGSWTGALGAAWLMGSAARNAASRPAGSGSSQLPAADPSRLAVAAACLGTPLIYYVLQMPTYDHACSAFTAAAVLWLSLRWRSRWTARRAAALGAMVGVGALVRAQDAVLAVLPLGLGLWGGAFRGASSGVKLRLGAALVLGLAAAFLPQLLAWRFIYGSATVIPAGTGFLRFSPRALGAVLFASRHGLLAWSPVAALGLIGLVDLCRARATRGLGVTLVAGFALEWLLASLPVDWWAGWSFGARRFTSCVPILALGLAAVVRRGRPWRIALAAALSLGLVQWLRVASRSLSGEADPGWNGLWGAGFWGFLPRIPAALWGVIATPWSDLQVVRRPQSTPPTLHPDAAVASFVLWLGWAVAVLLLARWLRRRVEAPGFPAN